MHVLGIITLSADERAQSPFDREKSDFHYLTVEARDEVGRGNRNAVELLIYLKDVNDNAPVFRKDGYEATLEENSDAFPTPFVVEAEDSDENGTENAQIRYRIIRGDSAGNFSVDSITGEIRPNGLIDYELLRIPPSPDGNDKFFELTVRAYDLGNPPLFSDVPVTIFVTDKNDNAPVFDRSLYKVTINEDLAGGSEIMQASRAKSLFRVQNFVSNKQKKSQNLICNFPY